MLSMHFARSVTRTTRTGSHWLGRYLAGTRTKGLIFKLDKNESFEVYCDSDWSGKWDREEALHDVDTA